MPTPDPAHFERHAARYGRARPPYPQELWDTLRDRGLLLPGHRALDLGAGTGQATGPLLAAGLQVTAVEPGQHLASQLALAHPTATVIVRQAEELEGDDESFELAVAATSIHWMDLETLVPLVHRLLVPTGRLLVWRNVFGDPSFHTPFRDRVAQIVRERRVPARPGPDPEDHIATASRLTSTGLFSVEHTATFRWDMELSREGVHDLFSTFSDWSPAEVDRVSHAAQELGGRVVEHYSSWLIILAPTCPDDMEVETMTQRTNL